jgi:NADH:ubiquinone oxidoreductase subunit 6 (subunit J)
MDSLHAIGFYVSSALSIAGALLVALLPGRGARGAALGLTGVGLAGIYLFLSAGFAAVVALVCYAGSAWLLAGQQHRVIEYAVRPMWRQLAALAAGGLLAALGYAAFRGNFVHANLNGDGFGGAAIGRLLFAHDALATEAVVALIVVALVGASVAWRGRGPSR